MEHRTLPSENETSETYARHEPNAVLTEQAATEETTRQTEAVETLAGILKREAARKRRGLGLYTTAVAAAGLIPLCYEHLLGKERLLLLLGSPYFFFVICLIPFGMILAATRPIHKARKATDALAGLQDVDTVGLLVDALNLDDRLVGLTAIEALTELLPQLRASDADLLTASQRAKLCHKLSVPLENPLFKDVRELFQPANRRAVNFQIAILKAFEQVGDRHALPIVERLANGEAKTAAQKRIRAAAQECLPFLQERVRQEEAPQTLLRAASAAEAAPSVLLRAAVGGIEAGSGQLLRAAGTEEESA